MRRLPRVTSQINHRWCRNKCPQWEPKPLSWRTRRNNGTFSASTINPFREGASERDIREVSTCVVCGTNMLVLNAHLVGYTWGMRQGDRWVTKWSWGGHWKRTTNEETLLPGYRMYLLPRLINQALGKASGSRQEVPKPWRRQQGFHVGHLKFGYSAKPFTDR